RHLDAERLRGFQVDDQLEFHRLLDWQVGWPFALENPAGVAAGKAICIVEIGSVTDQATCSDEFTKLVARGDCVAGRRGNQLIASAQEKRIAGSQDGIDTLLSEARERRFDVAFAARTQDLKLEPECARRGLHVSYFGFGSRVRWVEEKTHSSGTRHQLAQQLQPFRSKRFDQKIYTGDIAAGSAETGNQTKLDGVGAGHENDRNGCGGSFGRQRS